MAKLILAAALVSGILAACALTDQTVRLPAAEASVRAGGGAGRVIIILPVVDKRTPADHVGIKKNGFGVPIAKTYPDRHVGTWLRQRLKAELRAAGFELVRKEAAGSVLTIQLVLQKFFTEPILHWTSVDIESDLAVQMRVTHLHGVTVERSYYAKGLARGGGPAESNYTLAMEQATEYLMHRMVPDIIAAVQMSNLSEKRPLGDDQWTADPPTP